MPSETSSPRVTTALDFAPGDTARVDPGTGPVLVVSRTAARGPQNKGI